MVVCDFCGTPAPAGEGDDAVPLTWVTSAERDRTKVYCDRCARDHVRSIEAKLDSDHW
jgi:hypothetical protein